MAAVVFLVHGVQRAAFFSKWPCKFVLLLRSKQQKYIKIQKKFQLNHYVYESLQGLEILFSQIQ
jgi:hypothetical protein